jgi:hypothetical protein
VISSPALPSAIEIPKARTSLSGIKSVTILSADPPRAGGGPGN